MIQSFIIYLYLESFILHLYAHKVPFGINLAKFIRTLIHNNNKSFISRTNMYHWFK